MLCHSIKRNSNNSNNTINCHYIFIQFIWGANKFCLHVYFIEMRMYMIFDSKWICPKCVYLERELFIPKAWPCHCCLLWKWNLFFILIIAVAFADAVHSALFSQLHHYLHYIFHFMYFNYFKSAILKRKRKRMRMSSINYAFKCSSHLFEIRNNLTRYLFIWMWRNRMTTTMTMTMMMAR